MATTQVQTVTSLADKAKIAIAVVLLIASFAVFHFLAPKGVLLQWVGLLSVFLVSLVLFFTSESGRQLISFGFSAWDEVKKVVWPAPKEATLITVYVFGFVLLMAIFLWSTDKALEWIFYDLILGWRK
jgi:preprotein translocase subunit SecE